MSRPLKSIPARDRPRERLWSLGAGALSDRELVAQVVGSGTVGESALGVADGLLADSAGVTALSRVRIEELAEKRGIGPARAATLVAAIELGRRAQASGPDLGVRVHGPTALAELARAELAGLRHERLVAIVLGPGHRLRRLVTIAEGWSDRAPVPVREVIASVLRNDGVAFALAHNHPSGDPTPSIADRAATDQVERAAAAAGLRLLDHIVVAGSSWHAIRAGTGSVVG